MTNNLGDLMAAREKRQREAYHFDSPVAALEFMHDRLNRLDDLAGSALLIDSNEVHRQADQLAALTRACVTAIYQMRDERKQR